MGDSRRFEAGLPRPQQKPRRLFVMTPIVKAALSLLLGVSCSCLLQGCGGGDTPAKADPVSCTFEAGQVKTTVTWSCDGDKLMQKVDTVPATNQPAIQIPGIKCDGDELKKIKDAYAQCPKGSTAAASSFAVISAKTETTADDETKSVAAPAAPKDVA